MVEHGVHCCSFVVLLFSATFGAVVCFPDGAPLSACSTLTPQHARNQPSSRTRLPPARLLFPRTVASPGESVRIHLRGIQGQTFRGFMVQARNVAMQGMLVGSFRLVGSDSGAKTLDCPVALPDLSGSLRAGGGSVATANTATHTNNLEKRVVSLDWIPPQGFQGEVFFRYTVVQRFEEFWASMETDETILCLRRRNDGSSIPDDDVAPVSSFVQIPQSNRNDSSVTAQNTIRAGSSSSNNNNNQNGPIGGNVVAATQSPAPVPIRASTSTVATTTTGTTAATSTLTTTTTTITTTTSRRRIGGLGLATIFFGTRNNNRNNNRNRNRNKNRNRNRNKNRNRNRNGSSSSSSTSTTTTAAPPSTTTSTSTSSTTTRRGLFSFLFNTNRNNNNNNNGKIEQDYDYFEYDIDF